MDRDLCQSSLLKAEYSIDAVDFALQIAVLGLWTLYNLAVAIAFHHPSRARNKWEKVKERVSDVVPGTMIKQGKDSD